MRRTLMKSKIHRATVTDANLHYQGSVTLDPLLMAAADILENERIDVLDITNGNRLTTYAIPGAPGRGEVCLNGAAAHLVSKGDLVILVTYAEYEEDEARRHRPTVVFVDEREPYRSASRRCSPRLGGGSLSARLQSR
jgi:aspartate 1-decarboxylase